jgi:uncharacterized membrane protein YczE
MTLARRATLRGVALLTGLAGYGFSMALMVRAGLGLDPWDVFHQGLARHTGMTIGIASAVVGVAVLLAWIPLRNRPGIGTVANVIVIAVTVDAALAVLPTPTSLPVRVAMMVGAVVFNAFSTVLYVGAPACRCASSARRSRRPCSPSGGCWAAPSAWGLCCMRSGSGRWCRCSCG